MTERQSLLPTAPLQRLGRSSGRWSQDRRLEFIDFRLRWDGRLNRGDLTAFFGISVPQASLDIARYSELAPGNLEYDRSSRVYVAPQSFTPLFPASDAGRYLNELLAKCSELDAEQSSFLAWAPLWQPFRALAEHFEWKFWLPSSGRYGRVGPSECCTSR